MRWGVLSALAALLIIAQPAGAQAGRLAFNVDGDIWLMRADGSERQRLTRTPGKAQSGQADFSPDGTLIAFARGNEKSAIWVRGTTDATERRLTGSRGSAIDQSPDWRADGQTIAFVRHRFSENRTSTAIITLDLRSGREKTIKTASSRRTFVVFDAPSWSPDGERLLYTRTEFGRDGFAPVLYVLDVTSGRSTKLAGGGMDGAWSPDGQRIAFSSVRDRNGESCGSDECILRRELYVMNADGSGATRLTENKGSDDAPTWVPDGSAIVFGSTRNAPEGEQSELYAIRPDGSCLTWLTNGTQDSILPDWQPGSGGLPEPFECGGVPREPSGLVTPPARTRGLWLGQIGPRNVMLGTAERGLLSYDDCAAFEPSECGPPVDIDNGSVCKGHPLRNFPQSSDEIEVRRGALVYRTFDDVQVFSGDRVTRLYNIERDAADSVIDGLRPLPSADPVESLPPPRFPARVVARIERAQRLGTVRRVVRAEHVSRPRARQLVALAQALAPLGKLQPVDCPR